MRITLTGLDARTDLSQLASRITGYDIEFAVLVRRAQDNGPRYPSQEVIDRIVDAFPGRVALHICGTAARVALLDGSFNHTWLKNRQGKIRRIQVNGRVSRPELYVLLDRYGAEVDIITQHCGPNSDLAGCEVRRHPRGVHGDHEVLVDDSGGTGKVPDRRVPPRTKKRYGFAGGLSPETIPRELPLILEHNATWIDMESGLRSNDWFDIGRAVAAIEAVDAVLGTKRWMKQMVRQEHP